MKFTLNQQQNFNFLNGLVMPFRYLLFALSLVCLAWFAIQLMAPAPTLAPAVSTSPSVKYQMDQSPEARLLGVETSGGLTPPTVVLQGVFANGKGQGAVVMSIEGEPAISLRSGDEVRNGWTVGQLGSTYVVLERNGQRHQVDLPQVQVDPNLFKRVPSLPNGKPE